MYIHAIFVYLKWKEKTIELNFSEFYRLESFAAITNPRKI